MRTTSDELLKKCGLAFITSPEKERIATKILAKNPEIKGEASYPHCTALWNSLDTSRQEWIYKHCMFKHGYLDKIDFDGEPYTD